MLPLVDHDGLCAVTGLRRGLVDPSKGFGSDEIDKYPDELIMLLPSSSSSSSQAAPASSPWTIQGVEPEAGSRLGFQLVSIVGRFPDISEEDLDLVQISFGDKRQRPLRYSSSRILCHSIPVPQNVPHLTISVSFDGGFSFTDQDALFTYNDASIIHVGQTGSHVLHWGMTADVVNLREEADVELYYAAQVARPQVSEPPRSRLRRRITATAQGISKGKFSTTGAGEDAAKKSPKLFPRRDRKSISENTRAPLAQVAHSGRASWVETKYPGFMSRQQIAIDAFQREDLRVSVTSRRTREALLAKHGNGFAALDTLVDSFASSRPGPGVDGDATNAPSNNSMDRDEIDRSASNMAESIATNMASILPNLTPEQGNALSATKAQLAALQVQGMPVRSIACSEAGAIVLLEDGRLLAPVYRSKPLPGQKVDPDDPPPEMLMDGWLTLDTVSSVAQKTEELASDPVEEVDRGHDASGEVSGKRGLGWLGTLRNRYSPRTGKNDHSPTMPRSPASPRDAETTTATEPRGRTRLRLHQTTAAFRFLNSADPIRGSGSAISAAQSSETAGVEVVMIPPEHSALDAETPENQDEHPFRANPTSVFTTNVINPQGDEDGTNVPAWFFGQRTDAIDAARVACLPDMVFPRYQQVVRVAAGANHFCAITDDLNGAQLYTWGSNSHGQLGLGADVGDFVYTPKLVIIGDVSNGAARSQVRRLACGANTSICACLDDKGQSALYAWGATGFETSNFVRRVLRGSAKAFRNEDVVLEATFPHSMKHVDHCKALYASESSHSGMLASAQATSFLPIKCLNFRPTRREENSRAPRSPADQAVNSAAPGEDARRDSADAETFWNTRLDRWLLAVEDEAAVARSNIPYYVETDEASEELARQNKLGEVLDMHVQMYQTYVQDVERAMNLGAAQAETTSAEDVVWIKLRGLLRTVEEAKSDLDRRLVEVTQRQLVLRALARTNMLNKGTTMKAYRHANGEVTRQRLKESLRWTEHRGEKLVAEIAALDEQAELLLEQQETLQDQEEVLVDLMDDWQKTSLPVSNSSSQALSDDLDTLLQLASDLQACQIANLVRHGSLDATANSPVGLTTGAATVGPNLGRSLSRASARAQTQQRPQPSLEGALFAKTNLERIFASPEQLVSESSLTVASTDAFEGECLGLFSATHALHRKLFELYESSASFLKGDLVSRQLADMVCDLAEQKQLRNCALQAMLSESERGKGSQSAQTLDLNGVAATLKPQDIQAPMRVCNVESPFVDYNNIQ